MKEIRILVFGKAGVGKTSVINCVFNLKGDQKLCISNKAVGTTCTTQTIDGIVNNYKLTIVDTAGLNEGEKGTVTPLEAFKKLLQAVNDLEQGYDLIVHVIAKGRITEIDQKNQEMLKCLLGGNVDAIPMVLIVNKSEDTNALNSVLAINSNSWANKNASDLKKKLGGSSFAYIQCTSFPDLINDTNFNLILRFSLREIFSLNTFRIMKQTTCILPNHDQHESIRIVSDLEDFIFLDLEIDGKMKKYLESRRSIQKTIFGYC